MTVNADNTFHYFEYPKWYSHEINISSTTDGPLQWIVGAYYYNEKYTGTGSTADFFLNGPSSLRTPILGAAPNPLGIWSTGNYDLTTESKAMFGQVDWQATETLKVTAGLRYTKDKKSGTEFPADRLQFGRLLSWPLPGSGPQRLRSRHGGELALLLETSTPCRRSAALGLGNALAPSAALATAPWTLTTLAPKSTAGPIEGVTSPSVCTAGVCRQYTISSNGIASRLGDTWTP